MEWKNVVSKVAPWLGAALGGPLGASAVTLIGNALGISEATEDSLKQALSGVTQEHLLAIKAADAEFEIKMRELNITEVKDLENIAAGDRDSARKREMEVKDWTPRILAYLITLGYFAMLTFLVFGEIPATNKDSLYIMLGTLGTSWTGVIAYYYGSTAGSRAKTELLAKAQPI
jgi:hypothetical protein